MKQVIALWLTLVLSVGAFAAPAPQDSNGTGSTKAAPKKSSGSVNAQLDQLRQALEIQQQQIQQLRDQLASRDKALQELQAPPAGPSSSDVQAAQAAAAAAQAKADAAQNALAAQTDSVTKLNSDMADVKLSLTNAATTAQDEQKRVSALEGLVGRFRFSGDVRIRGESFYQSYTNCANCQDRNRARARVRFGIDGRLNEDFLGGFALATGSLGDPTTTNETFTNFFDRKTIGLDRGYITYNPLAHHWLSLTGGKFAYQWQRTSVTGDPDLNPEGFNEKLSFDMHDKIVKNFTVQGIQYLFNEVSKGADSFAAGGQLQGRLEFGRWTATPSFLVVNWRNIDALLSASAFAVQATTTGSTSKTTPVPSVPVPGEGPGCASISGGSPFPPCAFAPNGMTNSTYVDSKGVAHFNSDFVYTDFILNNQIKTGMQRLPFNLLGEYENNPAANAHPIDYKGKYATWLGKQSHVYLVDASLGQTRNVNDVQFGYAFLRQEQDSVLASFAESDQRAPTNIVQHRFYGIWKLRPNTVAAFTWWHGRTLNDNLENAALVSGWKPDGTSHHPEPWLNRLQFDLIYTF
jgi:hypothetical protein